VAKKESKKCFVVYSAMSLVRVASYNILCSALAPADRFCHCKPEDLLAPARFERILKLLDDEVRCRACAQQTITDSWRAFLR